MVNPFPIFNADIISDVDVAELLRFDEEKGADVDNCICLVLMIQLRTE